MAKKDASPDLSVTMAGVNFRSPLGVAAVGNHWGKELLTEPPEVYAEMNANVVLKHIRAGAGYIYVNAFSISEESIKKLQERSRPEEKHFFPPGGLGIRVMRSRAPEPPYGIEALYFLASPFWFGVGGAWEKRSGPARTKMMQILKEKKPADVPIIAGTIGLGDSVETFIDGARKCEELGADLIEINLSCPFPLGMRGAVDDYFQKRFPARFQGALLGDQPDLVDAITRAVVNAVSVPVGVKLTPETGFPRIVEIARIARDAGAKYVQLTNSAIGIAPPDIYNRGKPIWPYMDGNPLCMASGSWMRTPCYRNVAAVARFVPGIDIAAAGGLVAPEHCIEVMMLGATQVQLCTGVIEQGRGLLRQSLDFMKKFMIEQGYQSVRDFIGLGQQYIKYNEDVVMAPNVISQYDEKKCTKCGRCLDNICVALYSDHGKIKVNEERCAGCGGCVVACPEGAFKLVLKE